MSSRTLSILCVLSLAGVLVPSGAAAARAGACKGAHVVITKQTLQQARRATLCLLNKARARAGLKPLRLNRKLVRAARRHSRDMVNRRYFDHVSPDGVTPTRRLADAHYIPRRGRWTMGEDIAWGTGSYATPAQIVRSWMHSPPHRANILSPSFREIGVGIMPGAPVAAARAEHGATYTLDFGRRS